MARIENGYSSEQAKLPEYLENPLVRDMVPGNIFGVDEDELIVDCNSNCWINGDARFQTDFDSWDDETLAVIRINEGFVIDMTCSDVKKARFSISPTMEIIHSENEHLLPIIGFIVSDADLLVFDKQFKAQTGNHYVAKEIRKDIKKKMKKQQQFGAVAIHSSKD